MTRADDGFGNLVPINNPYGAFTKVYMRFDGKLAMYEVGTADHAAAIDMVRKTNNDHCLSSRRGRWRDGPCLAVVTKDAV